MTVKKLESRGAELLRLFRLAHNRYTENSAHNADSSPTPIIGQLDRTTTRPEFLRLIEWPYLLA